MKITFVTYHNWDTKRQGGFHKLAQFAADKGHKVNFFSFSRSYFSYFFKDERQNKNTLKLLSKGKEYKTSNGFSIFNFTWPTLKIPNLFYKYIPKRIFNWLRLKSFLPFKKIQNNWLDGTDYFVFESCDGIELLHLIKKFNPSAKIIYRPSDPLIGNNKTLEDSEIKIMNNANLNVIVNEDGVRHYEKQGIKLNNLNYTIIPNGVEINDYQKKYPVPDIFDKDKKVVLYVGVFDVEWNLVAESALDNPDLQFIVIGPIKPPPHNLLEIPNLKFIPGIYPKEVPGYITNCDLVMIPYQVDNYKKVPYRGITAKYYQAMAANKPIIAFHDTPKLKEYGVNVFYDFESFKSGIKNIKLQGFKPVVYNFEPKSWDEISDRFLEEIERL